MKCKHLHTTYHECLTHSSGYIKKEKPSLINSGFIAKENNNPRTKALRFEFNEQIGDFTPYLDEVQTAKLTQIDRNKLKLNFILKEDEIPPVHPTQGPASEAQVTYESPITMDSNVPFTFVSKFSFRNRVEACFHLEVHLSYDEITIIRSNSDIFMFNNPRMKKRKEFLNYSPAQVKFMQVYNLTRTGDEQYWLDLGLQLGYSVERIFQMLELSNSVFTNTLKRKLPSPTSFQQSKRQALDLFSLLDIPFSSPSSFPVTPSPQSFNDPALTLKTYNYQWLQSNSSTMESSPPTTIHLPSSYTYSLFLDFIQQKEQRKIQRLFWLREGKVTEVLSPFEFETLSSENYPELPISFILSDSFFSPQLPVYV